MNEMDQTFRDDASARSAIFSEDRHTSLVQSLAVAPASSKEAPLRMPRDLRMMAASAMLLLLSIVGVFSWKQSMSPVADAGQFGAPMHLAERSIVELQSVASKLSNDPSVSYLEQADDVLSFLAKQVSMTRSLAVTPPTRSRL